MRGAGFAVTAVLDAPRDSVFAAWAEPARLAAWWRPGRRGERREAVAYRRIDRPRRVVLSAGGAELTVTFARVGEQTEVVVHAAGGLPPAERARAFAEWDRRLRRLARYLHQAATPKQHIRTGGEAMRKIVASTNIALDGTTENPHLWHMEYMDESGQQAAKEQLFASDALLMGRATYEGFAQAWPNMTDEEGFADRMNSLPKYVASTTLESAPEWNNSHVLGGDLVTEVAKLKEQPGEDILMYGYGPVANTLMRNGLLDELRLWITPVFAGPHAAAIGDLLYRDGESATFEPVDVRRLDSGVIIASYRPLSAKA